VEVKYLPFNTFSSLAVCLWERYNIFVSLVTQKCHSFQLCRLYSSDTQWGHWCDRNLWERYRKQQRQPVAGT